MQDITRKTFGTWFVEKRENNPNVKTLQNRYFRCVCTCGNSFLARYDNIIKNKRRGCDRCRKHASHGTIITTRLEQIRNSNDKALRAHILGLVLNLGPKITHLIDTSTDLYLVSQIDELIKFTLEEPIIVNKDVNL